MATDVRGMRAAEVAPTFGGSGRVGQQGIDLGLDQVDRSFSRLMAVVGEKREASAKAADDIEAERLEGQAFLDVVRATEKGAVPETPEGRADAVSAQVEDETGVPLPAEDRAALTDLARTKQVADRGMRQGLDKSTMSAILLKHTVDVAQNRPHLLRETRKVIAESKDWLQEVYGKQEEKESDAAKVQREAKAEYYKRLVAFDPTYLNYNMDQVQEMRIAGDKTIARWEADNAAAAQAKQYLETGNAQSQGDYKAAVQRLGPAAQSSYQVQLREILDGLPANASAADRTEAQRRISRLQFEVAGKMSELATKNGQAGSYRTDFAWVEDLGKLALEQASGAVGAKEAENQFTALESMRKYDLFREFDVPRVQLYSQLVERFGQSNKNLFLGLLQQEEKKTGGFTNFVDSLMRGVLKGEARDPLLDVKPKDVPKVVDSAVETIDKVTPSWNTLGAQAQDGVAISTASLITSTSLSDDRARVKLMQTLSTTDKAPLLQHPKLQEHRPALEKLFREEAMDVRRGANEVFASLPPDSVKPRINPKTGAFYFEPSAGLSTGDKARVTALNRTLELQQGFYSNLTGTNPQEAARHYVRDWWPGLGGNQ